MAAQSGVTTSGGLPAHGAALPAVYADGIRAGLVGAVTIALWFFILDAIAGRPLYTPTVLGTALFRGTAGLDAPNLPIAPDLVLAFTAVHTLVFVLLGTAAALLLGVAERQPQVGFGVLILFVVFQFGFFIVCMLMADEVLHALAWPAVMVGNLLAAAAMGVTLRWRHASLSIAP